MKRAIVIIPTYNERENVAKVIPWLLTVFKKVKDWDLHILVVDDSSPDGTAEVVHDLVKKHKNVHLFLNKRKSGLGGAYLKGMAESFGPYQADAVFEFDADLSHDAEKIPLFLQKIDSGYDLVLGSRYIPGGGIPPDWGIHRKFLSVVGNLVIQVVMTNFNIRDWTTGFRAFTKEVYQAVGGELQGERFTGYTFQIGFLHKAVRKGFKIAEVPFKFVDRTEGHSKMGMEYIKNTLMYIFKVRIQEILRHRLFKFVVVGGIGALTQLLTLKLWWLFLPYKVASFLSIECAIVSNFILSNIWTFSDRRLKTDQIPKKFVQFNLASAGSILIQLVIAFIGDTLIGAETHFLTLPFIHFVVSWGLVFSVVGILVGMFWNFFAYNKFVWKKK